MNAFRSLSKKEVRSLPPFNSSLFQKPALEIAPHLLGKGLVRTLESDFVIGEIVEVEVYLQNEPSCHAFRGKTARNAPMFEKGGTLYVYFTYGFYFCLNIVTGQEGQGEAILIRALRPVYGLPTMFLNRKTAKKEKDLLSGPGKLCQAMAISLEHNGLPLPNPSLNVVDLGINYPSGSIKITPRIGISKATDLPYRFLVRDSPYVSHAKKF